jgi:hypothetical protein
MLIVLPRSSFHEELAGAEVQPAEMVNSIVKTMINVNFFTLKTSFPFLQNKIPLLNRTGGFIRN